MGTTPTYFNGSSTYSAQLNQEVAQAVAIAAAPLSQLNSNLGTLQDQSSELSTLQTDFTAVQTAIQSLDQANNGGGLAATASDSSVATATLDSAAAISGGTYDLNVISAGSPTTAVSNSGLSAVADPSTSSISSSSNFTLTVGGSSYAVSPATNTLDALAQAINAAGAGVSATLVNLGSPSAPDYTLSIQSTTLGNVAIQLNDGTQNLLNTVTTGAPAEYQVNGQPATPILSDTGTITLAPGLTADLLGPGDTTITVASDPSAASSALSSFVTAYNAVATELNKNHGTAGGALTGQSIVLSLQQSLESLTNYSGGTGLVENMADLGLTFNSTGQLSFDQSQFTTASATNPSDVAAFLGSAASGTGFLGSASNILTSLDDPSTGVLQSSENTVQQQITSDTKQITATETQVTTVQNQMTAQMAAADSLIASLQAQSSYFTNLFAAEQNVQNSIAND